MVHFQLPDNSVVAIGHGEIIGRAWTAAIQLDDPRISEAHAMVSLRGERLRLLALRGRFAVEGKPLTELDLTEGLAIELARDLTLTVAAIELPTEVMGIQGDGLARRVLPGVCSLVLEPRPTLVPKHHPRAAATLWSAASGWRLRVGQEPPEPLLVGQAFTVGGLTFQAIGISIEQAGLGATRVRGAVNRPMRLVAHYDSLHIHRPDQATLVLSGLSARMLSELVAYGAPAPWAVLAGELWPDETDRVLLRRKLDASLSRLRKKLRAARIRIDLVRADRGGNLELLLHEHDRAEDHS
ncbi:MAG: hypothetical protein ACI9MR_001539 [Myxococcota bacterium]|jgi:hypothetical protein